MDFEKEIFGNSSDDNDLAEENLEEMFASSDDEVYKERVLPNFKKTTLVSADKKPLSADKKVIKKKKIKPIIEEPARELNPEELKREQARQDFDEALERIKPRGRKRDLRDESVF